MSRTPVAEIRVNGTPVASTFNERLISVRVVDKEGVTSDTITCELNDGNPFARIPKKGDIIEAFLGYRETGVAPFGKFTVDDPEVRCLPYGLTINGKGADMRDKLKEGKSRHWDEKSVKDIVSEIAKDHGLAAVVDDAVGAHVYEWFGQQGESDLHVVERLARRHNALFTVKDGKLIFAEKGSGRTPAGTALPAVVATPDNIVVGTCRIQFAHRQKFKKVRAGWHDREAASRQEVEEESDDEGTADFTLAEPFADEAEAASAAKSKAKQLFRETIRATVTLVGDPSIRAGCPLHFSGVRPEIDDLEFVIETAAHAQSKAGYVVEVEAKLKQKAKPGAKPAGTSVDDPDKPTGGENSPADPDDWTGPGGIGHG